MDKNKKFLIIGSSVGAAALLALIIVSVALANTPKALIVRAAANTISDAKRIEVFDVADDVANGGSIAVSANLDKVAKDDLTVQAKLYTDAKKLKGAFELTALNEKDKVLQAKVMYNQDKFAFNAPQIIDGTYGVNLKKLAKNLPGSIFDPEENTDYSLDEDRFDYFMNMKDTVKNDKNMQRDIEAMSAKYRQVFIEKLLKYSKVKKDSKTITVGGDKIPCTVITAVVDEDSLAKIAEDIVEYANNDASLEKLLLRIASNGSYRDDPDEYVDKFFDALDDYVEEIEKLEDSNVDISIDFYITKSGRRLAQLDIEAEYGTQEYEASLILGKNVAKSKQISLEIENKKRNTGYSIEYTVKEDSSKRYEAEIEITESRARRGSTVESTSEIKVDWDRRAGDFELKYQEKNNTTTVKGNLKQKGDKYVFMLAKIVSKGNVVPYVKNLELTITVDRHDPAPGVPGSFTEITKMDERDYKHFMKDLEGGAKDLWDEYFSK